MNSVYLDQGKVSVVDRDMPARPQGYALIRLQTAGICSTDLHLQRGYYGFSGVPGHEFVGTVTSCDDPRWLGQLVVGEINLACGACEWCARGLGRHCPNRTVLGIVDHPGAFAEYLTLPEANLHEVPAGVTVDQAVFTEPVAAACEILDQVPALPDTIAVLGDGKLGLLIAQVLQLAGAQVDLYGRHPDKMQLVAPLGIRARDLHNPSRYPMVVEATGSSAGLQAAVNMTLPRGTLVMKSTVYDRVSIDTAPIIVNEITMVGSRCGRFESALEHIRSGRLILEPLIAARYPLTEAPQAFAKAAEKGTLKVMLHR